MLKDKIIENTDSEYNSPTLLVSKKSSDGNQKWRLVIDYRQLNKKLIPDRYPLPRIDETLDQLGRAKWFVQLDLAAAHQQCPMTEESKKYTCESDIESSWSCALYILSLIL